MHEVRVGEFVAQKVTAQYGPQRGPGGEPSEWDFWSGPLTAALIGFRDFDRLPPTRHSGIRTLHIVDPVFGPVVFVGVLVAPLVVEIADVEGDPDYWDIIEADPDV